MHRLHPAGWYLPALLAILITVGCTGGAVRLAKDLWLLDLVPEGQPRGYVEFSLDPVISNAPDFLKHSYVSVCWELKERPCDQLHPTYKAPLYAYTVERTQRMRMAAPPGLQHYTIESNRNVPITVQAGMVTPVVIKVVGQYVERMATYSSTYSGSVVSTTTTTTGAVYGWTVTWQVQAPKPVDAKP